MFMSFPFSLNRFALLPGKDGTAGKTITRSEYVWHVPCLSPHLQHESASIASNRPQLCDTPCTYMHHLVAFRVLLSSLSPKPFSSDFLPLFCTALFRNEVPITFLWTLISHVHNAALRQPGKSLLELMVAKQIQRRKRFNWLHLVEVHNTKPKTAQWQEQSIFSLYFFPFCIVVNKDYFQHAAHLTLYIGSQWFQQFGV